MFAITRGEYPKSRSIKLDGIMSDMKYCYGIVLYNKTHTRVSINNIKQSSSTIIVDVQ